MGTYLVCRNGTYHFRIQIPSDLVLVLGSTEIRRSLRTGNKRLAKQRAGALSQILHTDFDDIRAGRLKHMTDAEIKALVDAHVRKLLEQDVRARVMRSRGTPDNNFPGYEHIINLYRQCAAHPDTMNVPGVVDDLIKEYGLNLTPDSYEHRRLAHELTVALQGFYKVMMRRDAGDYDFEHVLFPALPKGTKHTTVPAPPAPVQEDDPTSPLISEVLARWEEKVFGKYKAATRKEFRNAVQTLIFIHGDQPMKSLEDHAACRNIADALQALPKNRNKLKIYRDKSLKQLLAMKIPQDKRLTIQSVKTIGGHMVTFLNWAKKQGFINNNFLYGKLPSGGNTPTRPRRPYTLEELKLAFHSDEYVNDTFKHPYQFWLPVLALFTGARCEELAQLHVDDVKQVDGVWCLDINEEGDKTVKNESSRRLVPLHPFLTRQLKFPKWVDKLRGRGRKIVFSELKPEKSTGKRGHEASRWYRAYRTKQGFETTFHEFRNTFINACKQLDINLLKEKETVGHKVEDMSYGRYADRYNVKILYDDVIKRVKFSVNLDHLRKSRFIKGL